MVLQRFGKITPPIIKQEGLEQLRGEEGEGGGEVVLVFNYTKERTLGACG